MLKPPRPSKKPSVVSYHWHHCQWFLPMTTAGSGNVVAFFGNELAASDTKKVMLRNGFNERRTEWCICVYVEPPWYLDLGRRFFLVPLHIPAAIPAPWPTASVML